MTAMLQEPLTAIRPIIKIHIIQGLLQKQLYRNLRLVNIIIIYQIAIA